MRKIWGTTPFAQWLKEQRHRLHLLQREMAELCGVCTRQYRRWECGECEPNVINARKIAQAVGVDEDVVFDLLDQ
ncbi:MAG: helix-turn-helix transcriptional regulator [Armatimonadota bacterium]